MIPIPYSKQWYRNRGRSTGAWRPSKSKELSRPLILESRKGGSVSFIRVQGDSDSKKHTCRDSKSGQHGHGVKSAATGFFQGSSQRNKTEILDDT
jgi:hypothetical protein